mmetsp:Transcript_145064/g.404140  ORF Transcript_145064/g.404140 Transcript_145064/m.404140 type:complete len:207 (-) Transcript_145064:32-652(-)
MWRWKFRRRFQIPRMRLRRPIAEPRRHPQQCLLKLLQRSQRLQRWTLPRRHMRRRSGRCTTWPLRSMRLCQRLATSYPSNLRPGRHRTAALPLARGGMQKAPCREARCQEAPCQKAPCRTALCPKALCQKAQCRKARCPRLECRRAQCQKERHLGQCHAAQWAFTLRIERPEEGRVRAPLCQTMGRVTTGVGARMPPHRRRCRCAH